MKKFFAVFGNLDNKKDRQTVCQKKFLEREVEKILRLLVTSVEFLDTTAGFNVALASREKRMTL